MAQAAGEQVQVQIKADEKELVGQFSNLVMFHHTAEEFTVHFIYVFPNVPQGKLVSSVIVSPGHAKRILRALDQESPGKSLRLGGMRLTSRRPRPFWMGAFSGIGGSSIAAGIAFFVMASPLTNPVLDEVVSAHVRSLMPDHLIDVVSTDKHTVKPWFAGHTDVSPVVADFDQQGYRLVGGRADYFDHQRTAVVVYQHGSHVINVFSWAADQRGLPKNTTRNGYHLAFWKTGNLVYCAVSDTAWDELLGLTRLLQDSSASDAR